MKLNKKLLVNGSLAAIEKDEIRLGYMETGSAILQVRLDEEPATGFSSTVSFSLGWNFESSLNRFFYGYIERAVYAGKGLYRLFCRENSGKMEEAAPISLRHPLLTEVMQVYARHTGITFNIPRQPYASTPVPYFYGLGSGMQALQSLGDVFSIPDYFWQCGGDGKIFIGSYADSFWSGKTASLPEVLFQGGSIDGSRTIEAVPVLRPGATINGRKIKGVTLRGSKMEIKFNA